MAKMKSKRLGLQPLQFSEVKRRAVPVLSAILGRWLPGGTMRGREYVVKNPKRADARSGSFSINVKTGRWADFATGDKGGDVISLAAYLFSLSQKEACLKLAKMLGVTHDRN